MVSIFPDTGFAGGAVTPARFQATVQPAPAEQGNGGVAPVDLASGAISLSWNAVEGADEYLVLCGLARDRLNLVGSTTGTSFSIANLAAGRYYVQLLAKFGPRGSIVAELAASPAPSMTVVLTSANFSGAEGTYTIDGSVISIPYTMQPGDRLAPCYGIA